MTTSPELSSTFLATYDLWVTQLRQEYTQRKKLARHMRDNEYSSSLFTTPCASDSDRNTQYQQGGPALSMQVKQWKTPCSTETDGGTVWEKTGDIHFRLRDQVQWVGTNGDGSFPTPQARDYRSPRLDPESRVTQDLNEVVNWPTPDVQGAEHDLEKFKAHQKKMKERHKGRTGNGVGFNLKTAVRAYPTPSSRDSKQGTSTMPHRPGHKPMLDQFVNQWPTPTFAGHNQGSLQEWGGSGNPIRRAGQLVQDENNTNGSIHELSRGRLNPKWVLQLMATTFEKIFFVRPATASLQTKRN